MSLKMHKNEKEPPEKERYTVSENREARIP